MNSLARTIQDIAHDAHEDLGSAHIALSRIESLLYSTLSDKTMSPHIRNLVHIAWNLACDAANTADVDFEAISKALSDCAPQGPQFENVARIPLKEFAKGRQHAAAQELGVQQAAISKAIRVGREIYVTRHADGSITATEVRAFPSSTTERDPL
ncbi:Cro/CI family transcriptional regulator [Pseudomonas parakoreensis]|uniref:Cro/CI family transcriptional regulator n=1 Tax=Pseudomonas parakoreensis TaxID=2892331 RepID=UPI00283AA3D7|nr:Cro/CI family transcriptional regulator [Pseudomonas parakoreensis]